MLSLYWVTGTELVPPPTPGGTTQQSSLMLLVQAGHIVAHLLAGLSCEQTAVLQQLSDALHEGQVTVYQFTKLNSQHTLLWRCRLGTGLIHGQPSGLFQPHLHIPRVAFLKRYADQGAMPSQHVKPKPCMPHQPAHHVDESSCSYVVMGVDCNLNSHTTTRHIGWEHISGHTGQGLESDAHLHTCSAARTWTRQPYIKSPSAYMKCSQNMGQDSILHRVCT